MRYHHRRTRIYDVFSTVTLSGVRGLSFIPHRDRSPEGDQCNETLLRTVFLKQMPVEICRIKADNRSKSLVLRPIRSAVRKISRGNPRKQIFPNTILNIFEKLQANFALSRFRSHRGKRSNPHGLERNLWVQTIGDGETKKRLNCKDLIPQLLSLHFSPLIPNVSKPLNMLLTIDLYFWRRFIWNLMIANINAPIHGADFISHFGILIDLQNRRTTDN